MWKIKFRTSKTRSQFFCIYKNHSRVRTSRFCSRKVANLVSSQQKNAKQELSQQFICEHADFAGQKSQNLALSNNSCYYNFPLYKPYNHPLISDALCYLWFYSPHTFWLRLCFHSLLLIILTFFHPFHCMPQTAMDNLLANFARDVANIRNRGRFHEVDRRTQVRMLFLCEGFLGCIFQSCKKVSPDYKVLPHAWSVLPLNKGCSFIEGIYTL